MKYIVFVLIGVCSLSFKVTLAQDAPSLSGINCNYNNPEYERSILFGEQLCFTICSQGATETQTTYLKVEELPTNATFSVVNKGDLNEYGRICFDNKSVPKQVIDTHKVVLRAYNTSDFSGDFTEETYTVYIQQLLEIDFEVGNSKCGEISVKAWRKNDVELKQWLLNFGGKVEVINDLDTAKVLFKNITDETVNISVTAISENGYNPTKALTYPVSLVSPFWTNKYDLLQCPNGTAKVNLGDFAASNATFKWIDFLHNEAVKTFERKNDTVYKIAGEIGTCLDTLSISYKVLNLSQGFSKNIKSGTAPKQIEVTLIDPTDADSFILNFDNGESEIVRPSSFPLVKTFAEPGTFNIMALSYKKGVNSCADTFTFSPINIYPTSIKETQSIFRVYPNPASSFLFFDTENEILNVKIHSLAGKELMTQVSEKDNSIDIRNLENGIYILKIEGLKSSFNYTFIKN